MFKWHRRDESREIEDGYYVVMMDEEIGPGPIFLARFDNKIGWMVPPHIQDMEISRYASINQAMKTL